MIKLTFHLKLLSRGLFGTPLSQHSYLKNNEQENLKTAKFINKALQLSANKLTVIKKKNPTQKQA